MTPRTRFVVAAAVVVAAIGGLIAFSLANSTAYYKTIAELTSAEPSPQEKVRVAGKVAPQSISRNGAVTTFSVTDGKAALPVTTGDLLPDTFGAGVDVVAEGVMAEGIFSASSVLTKCPSKFKART
ncbi:MAG: cytochrome c maturation protein CcmE [Actinomycetota bacterium]